MDDPDQLSLAFGIAAVERETGLLKDTLRVWERRYNFPQPVRDNHGIRSYPAEQVDKLRHIKRLLDLGYRPGKLIGLNIEQLQMLTSPSAAMQATRALGTPAVELMQYLSLCREQRAEELRDVLAAAMLRVGLQRFVIDIAAPLTALVGEAWAQGSLTIAEEHLYTEAVQAVMRNAVSAIPIRAAGAGTGPQVLLTTFPQEQHGLGLLMAEAMLVLEGAQCVSLGTRTPIAEIVQAAAKQRAQIVALSFSGAMNANQAAEGLRELRALLPQSVEIWAGGACPALVRRTPAGVCVLDLGSLHSAVDGWRARHATRDAAQG